MSTASINNPVNLLFGDVIVVLDDGNEILMKRCKNCDYVTANGFNSKRTHSIWCASKWSFRYLHRNINGASGVRAKCERCQIELSRPNDKEMKQHSELCLQRNSPLNTRYGIRKSADIEYVSMNSVSAMEIRTQKKREEAPLAFKTAYRTTYISTPNGKQRYAEYRACKLLVESSSQGEHRDQCSPDSEEQIVSELPVNLSAEVCASPARAPVTNHKCCFICNTKISETFVKMHGTVTSHSGTPVYKYVNRFLDGKPSIRHLSFDEINSNRALLCSRCFNKINDFDLACVTAMRLHNELKWELSKTEGIYTSQKRKMESELIIGIPLDS